MDDWTDNNTITKKQKVSATVGQLLQLHQPHCSVVTNGHTGFHYLARYSFGTKICKFNYEEQAAEWHSLDRISNNLYYALHELFLQPVCTFNIPFGQSLLKQRHQNCICEALAE